MKLKKIFIFLIINILCFLIVYAEGIEEKYSNFLKFPTEENLKKLEKEIFENQNGWLLLSDLIRYRKKVIERDFPNSMTRIEKLNDEILLKEKKIVIAELEILKTYPAEVFCPVLAKMAQIESADETYIWTAAEISLRSGLCKKEIEEVLSTGSGRKLEIWKESKERWK